jgi:MFS transporter, DHA2 family, multidrug resistance protein
MYTAARATDASLNATSREWLGLAVIALPCMVYSMDLTVLNLAIPVLTADLRPSASQLLWIIDIYGFMVAGFLMVMGTLGDRVGRRKVLLIGAAAFGAVSMVAAFSRSVETLILARAALGVAGATLAPSTLSLITNMFRDPEERTLAVSLWISSFSAGAIVGPLIGGFLIQYSWWGAAFLAGVPVMATLLLLGPFLLPEYRDPKAGGLDFASAILSLTAVLSFIYGVKRGAEAGADAISTISMLLGMLLAFVFVRRQSQLSDPLIDLELFRMRELNVALFINILGVFFMYGAFVLIGQYYQLVAGLSPVDAGLWSVPSAVAFTATSVATPALAKRIRPAHLLAGGLAMSALGFLGLVFTISFYGVLIASIVFSVGFTPVITLTTEIIVTSAPPERAGAASALSETANELGGALGVAMLGSLGAFIYRSKITGAALANLPVDAAREAGATLGGAVDAATKLPSERAGELLTLARGAFNVGLQTMGLIGAVSLFVAALSTLATLRKVQPGASRD